MQGAWEPGRGLAAWHRSSPSGRPAGSRTERCGPPFQATPARVWQISIGCGRGIRPPVHHPRALECSCRRKASSWADVARPGPHQLHLVKHPLRILVEDGEFHRPQGAGRGIASHQSAAQQHVLGAHDDGRPLGGLEPPRPNRHRPSIHGCCRLGAVGRRDPSSLLRCGTPSYAPCRMSDSPACASGGTRPVSRAWESDPRSLLYIHANVTPADFPEPVGAMRTSGQLPSASASCQANGEISFAKAVPNRALKSMSWVLEVEAGFVVKSWDREGVEAENRKSQV